MDLVSLNQATPIVVLEAQEREEEKKTVMKCSPRSARATMLSQLRDVKLHGGGKPALFNRKNTTETFRNHDIIYKTCIAVLILYVM